MKKIPRDLKFSFWQNVPFVVNGTTKCLEISSCFYE